jgi:hypothetical protein
LLFKVTFFPRVTAPNQSVAPSRTTHFVAASSPALFEQMANKPRLEEFKSVTIELIGEVE